MKIMKFILVASFVALVQWASAQSGSPVISDVYSDEVIREMIREYRQGHSREVAPPEVPAGKFRVDFPGAVDAEWEVAGGVYEVEFEVRLRDWKAFYDAGGRLLMTVEEVRRSELPAAARKAALARYPRFRFEDIDRIRRGTEVFYRVELERREMEVELLVRADGTVMEEAGW